MDRFRFISEATCFYGAYRCEISLLAELAEPYQIQVVPAPEATSDRWTHPPFSGHYDGDYIWGRGSEDDKSNVIAILSAIDSLLKAGFEPQRTVVFAVGFDEEGGAPGGYGARSLAEHLLEVYGDDGVELIVSVNSQWC